MGLAIRTPVSGATIVLSDYIVDGSEERAVICAVSEPYRAEIVLAVNAHDDLVAALLEFNAALDDGLCNGGTPGFDSGRLGRAQDAARAALAKAGVTP